MTYSLNTLNNSTRSGVAPARTGWGRFASELILIAGVVLLAFWFLSLLTYSLHDPAWSTSGDGAALGNRGGRLGALIAAASHYHFG